MNIALATCKEIRHNGSLPVRDNGGTKGHLCWRPIYIYIADSDPYSQIMQGFFTGAAAPQKCGKRSEWCVKGFVNTKQFVKTFKVKGEVFFLFRLPPVNNIRQFSSF